MKDVEKGPPNGDGPFNLLNCLTSFTEANKAAGIQAKHVGVIWENLQVVVGGSIEHKVRTYFVGVGTDILHFKQTYIRTFDCKFSCLSLDFSQLIHSSILSAYMFQNSLGLIRSVWRFFSPNTPTKNDADAKTILNRCAPIFH
jgi:hypothetical protein